MLCFRSVYLLMIDRCYLKLTLAWVRMQILRKLKHENIIEMLDSFETAQEFCVVTEFAQVTPTPFSVFIEGKLYLQVIGISYIVPYLKCQT